MHLNFRRKLSIQEAAQVLVQELNYPKEKAYQYAKQFDKNNDGQLSASEITAFTSIIDETLVSSPGICLLFYYIHSPPDRTKTNKFSLHEVTRLNEKLYHYSSECKHRISLLGGFSSTQETNPCAQFQEI